MEDKRFLLEHTKIFEKDILNRLDDGFNKIYEYISKIKYISPKIYTVVMNDNDTRYDFFLSKIIEKEDFYLYSKYLDSIYIDKNYFKLKEIENNVYIGKFIIQNEEYRFKFILERDIRYDNKISNLYNSFLLSNFKWYGVDKRDINRMYRVLVLEYLDDISLIEDINFSNINIDYGLDEDFKLNLNIFWNILEGVNVSKTYLTNLDGIGYKYILEKEENIEYLIKDDNDVIEDIVTFSDRIEIYSKLDSLYLFNVYKLYKFEPKFISNYTTNYIYEIDCKNINLEYIKRYIEKYNIEVVDIKKTKEKQEHLIIPEYNSQITRLYIAYIYVKVKNISNYDKLFLVKNLLQLEMPLYEILIYE